MDSASAAPGSLLAALGHGDTHPVESSSLLGGSPLAAGSSPKPGGSWDPRRGRPSAKDNTGRGSNLSVPFQNFPHLILERLKAR